MNFAWISHPRFVCSIFLPFENSGCFARLTILFRILLGRHSTHHWTPLDTLKVKEENRPPILSLLPWRCLWHAKNEQTNKQTTGRITKTSHAQRASTNIGVGGYFRCSQFTIQAHRHPHVPVVAVCLSMVPHRLQRFFFSFLYPALLLVFVVFDPFAFGAPSLLLSMVEKRIQCFFFRRNCCWKITFLERGFGKRLTRGRC